MSHNINAESRKREGSEGSPIVEKTKEDKVGRRGQEVVPGGKTSSEVKRRVLEGKKKFRNSP